MTFLRSFGRVCTYLALGSVLAMAESTTGGVSSCSVAPLERFDEPDAAVDTSGLTKATANALARLRQLVASLGGTLKLSSAYRPPAYQEHLQAIWDKWKALKANRLKDCRSLRTQVSAEFRRHGLLKSQRPVSNSDHTRGVGIDAALVLPSRTRRKRSRVSLDSLARAVGFHRPDVRRDPVHFRLLASSLDDTPPLPATN